MNIYEKVNKVKLALLDAKLTKSGKNNFANFDYFELADIIPTIIRECDKNKLYLQTSFDDAYATLKIIDIEKTEMVLTFTSPMRELELKGCNSIQSLGGVETYSRRYLLLMAFDIVENDQFDAVVGKDNSFGKANTPSGLTGKEMDGVLTQPQNTTFKPVPVETIQQLILNKNYDINAQLVYSYFDKYHWKTVKGEQINIGYIDFMIKNGKVDGKKRV